MSDQSGLQTKNTQMSDRVPEQLKPYLWRKGVSGNPSGRRKGAVSLKVALLRHLRANPGQTKAIVQALIDKAVLGDVAAIKVCAQLLGELGVGQESTVNVAVGVPPFEIPPDEVREILRAKFEDIVLVESGAVPALPVPAGQEPAQEPAGGAGVPGNSG
ncbi:MAG: hypothetical protein GX456_15830 [Verrucomicrobia bacterium]|nr:hypothetical protein [Verrucomicrobiota bacterium]